MSTNIRFLPILGFLLFLSGNVFAQPKEALTFGRAIMGSLGSGVESSTEVLITNKDPEFTQCEVLVILSLSGTTQGQAVLINGQTEPSNLVQLDIPRGGTRKVAFTSDGNLAAGAILLAPIAPCDENSISATGRFKLASLSEGLQELYTINPNSRDEWLRNGRCVAISTCLRRNPGDKEPANNLGIAHTSVLPGFPAPSGTKLIATVFDSDGRLAAPQQSFPVTGEHKAFFPLDEFGLPDGAVTLILCLLSSDPNYKVDLTTIQAGFDNKGNVQFDAPAFADGFESGDPTAWSDQ